VLKPEWMLNVDPLQPIPDRTPCTLNVHVMSAFRPQVSHNDRSVARYIQHSFVLVCYNLTHIYSIV
jgi:hypothetical protein